MYVARSSSGRTQASFRAALREPARTLRVNLEIARGRHDAKVIVVASALPSEGKSTIVRNLALTYRDAGARVAVVESDLRRPVLAAQFGLVALARARRGDCRAQ